MSRPSTPPTGEAYGAEGQFFICATCGKSIPISQIEGQCFCGRKVCKTCGKQYPLCARCGWVICRNCAYQSRRDKKWYHVQHKPSECLVVTACYGSPLSTEVQYLRMFRDKTVLETSFGKRFMDILERIYYSFSPQVAIYLKSHLATKDVVRSIVVVPLFESLSATKRLTGAFSNKELRVIFIALLSSINVTMGLPFWKIISFLKRRK